MEKKTLRIKEKICMVEVWNLPDFVSLGVSAWSVFFTVVSDHMETNQ